MIVDVLCPLCRKGEFVRFWVNMGTFACDYTTCKSGDFPLTFTREQAVLYRIVAVTQ